MIAETTPGGLALKSSASYLWAAGRLTRQLSRFGLLSPPAPLLIILQMILVQLLQVCREELRKAKPAIIAAYEVVREADDRALQTLLLFFQDR